MVVAVAGEAPAKGLRLVLWYKGPCTAKRQGPGAGPV